jgi:methylated-DNA-[protein]-cysteine S-methyltransferase
VSTATIGRRAGMVDGGMERVIAFPDAVPATATEALPLPRGRIGLVTPLGPLLLEADAAGLRRIRFAAPGAVETPTCPATRALLVEAARQIGAYFAGRLRHFRLPLAPEGTRFQRVVWAFIADVPHGATLTYGDLAALVGSGPRAVARACGANPLPLVVPCHRIVGATPSSGGYSAPGGMATKRRLLELEADAGPLFA